MRYDEMAVQHGLIMARREYKGGSRRTRTNRVRWSDITILQVEQGISQGRLAEILGVRAPYVSRLHSEAETSEGGFVRLTTQQVLRLREEGLQFRIHADSPPRDALHNLWESLTSLPASRPQTDELADALRRYRWTSFWLEFDAAPQHIVVSRVLPGLLARFRQRTGIEIWQGVARSIGLGIVQAWEQSKPSMPARELVVRLLEQDVRHPLVRFPSSWENAVVAGESPFAGVQALAISSHIASRQCPVKIALDPWPGYFPFWVARRELRDRGIGILFVGDSATKMRMLIDGQVDVIGTTPGGLMLGHGASCMDKLVLLAVLNRSNGADQVLHRPFIRPIRNPAQRPRAAMTEGSTSELLFRAFARGRQQGGVNIECMPVSGYVPTAQLLLRDHLIEYVSTWEPYATLLRDIVPELRVVASTTMNDMDLVADYLVSARERTGRPLRDAVAIVMSVWDRVIAERRHLHPKFIECFSRECAVSSDSLKRIFGLVSFFTTRQMAWRLRNDVLAKQFVTTGRVTGVSSREASANWGSLIAPIPQWLRPQSR